MRRFTFQFGTTYRAKRPQDLDCVGFLARMRAAYLRSHEVRAETTEKPFGRRKRVPATVARDSRGRIKRSRVLAVMFGSGARPVP
jgi:hypothetical protein